MGHLKIKTVFPGTEISMMKIRRLRGRLSFIMEIPKQMSWHFYVKNVPPSGHDEWHLAP